MREPSREEVVEVVLSQQQDAMDGKVARVVRPFLGGVLYLVEFSHADGARLDNFVFYKDGNLTTYRFSHELLHAVANEGQHPNAVISLLAASGVEAIIAGLLTATICFLAVRGVPIPEILGSALTAILGFYFGTKMSQAKPASQPSGREVQS